MHDEMGVGVSHGITHLQKQAEAGLDVEACRIDVVSMRWPSTSCSTR